MESEKEKKKVVKPRQVTATAAATAIVSKGFSAIEGLILGKKTTASVTEKINGKSAVERKRIKKKKNKTSKKKKVGRGKETNKEKIPVLAVVRPTKKKEKSKVEVKTTKKASFTKDGKLDQLVSFRTAMVTAQNEVKRNHLDKRKLIKATVTTKVATTKTTAKKMSV